MGILHCRILRRLAGAALFALAAAAGAAEPQLVTFPSGNLELRGFLFKPDGNGPFPAVLYNHGSEKHPGTKSEIGDFFAGRGYVVFVPHRRGQGRSPGNYIMDELATADRGMRGQRLVELHERQLEDVVAALNYLKGVAYVDARNISVAGCSFGGSQTVLAAEKELGLRAAVPFAPAAQTWAGSLEIRGRLLSAAGKATVPVFLIQAENDYDLAPSRELAKALEQSGRKYKSTIYPAYGSTPADGHGGFCFRGVNVWCADVLSFLEANRQR